MIVIYINGEGTAEKLSPQHVYQGSNQSGVLVFAPTPPQTEVGIAFKLPDGTSTPYYHMTYQGNYEGLSQYEFTLPSSITQLAGHAAIALQALYSDGQQNSQLIEFTIEESVVVLPPELPPNVYDLLRQAISQNTADISDNATAIGSNAEAIKINADNIAKNADAIKGNSVNIIKNATDIKTLQGQIGNIETLSERAQEASANAVNTANEAKTTADGLANSIEQANENASQAVNTANEAENTANSLADRITKANETADSAVATANGAVQDIDEYKKQINSDVEGLREDINKSQFFKGMFNTVEELKERYPNATENDYAYIIAGNQWIYINGEWTDSGEPTPNTAVPRGTSIPLMDGVGSAGTSSAYASEDHRHPSDSTKLSISDAETNYWRVLGIYQGDLNSLYTNGVYRLGGSATNYPSGETYGSQLIVTNSNLTCCQLYISFSTGEIYSRGGVINTGEWSPWVKNANDATVVHKGGDTMTGDLITPQILSNGFRQRDASKNYVDLIDGEGGNFGVSGIAGNVYRLQNMLRFLGSEVNANTQFNNTHLAQCYNANNGAPTNNGHWIVGAQSSSDYGAQFALSDNGNAYYRNLSAGVWNSWETFLKLDPAKLEPTTANGWTIGGASLKLPTAAGIYLISINNGVPVIFVYSGQTGVFRFSYCTRTDSSVYVIAYGTAGSWSATPSLSITSVAYKKLA